MAANKPEKGLSAEEADVSFAAIVSHELRTPLTSIKASVALLQEVLADEAPSEVLHFLEVCSRNADRSIRLLDGVMDMARSHAGVSQLKLSSFDLAQVAADAVCDMKGLADQNKVDLTCSECSSVLISADRGKVEQILFNLLSNGIKFAKGAWIAVKVTAAPDRARMEVADGGPGIAADDFKRIFEKFTQVHRSAKPDFAGVGLGLSIVRTFVEEHHGDVWVESRPGEGSRFVVELPLSQSGKIGGNS